MKYWLNNVIKCILSYILYYFFFFWVIFLWIGLGIDFILIILGIYGLLFSFRISYRLV